MVLKPLLLWTLQLLCIQIEAFTSNNIKSNIISCAQHYNNGGGENKDYTRKSIILYAQTKSVDVCIIGGGISGLAAAITTAEKAKQQQQQQQQQQQPPSILILESDSSVGGRVRSDYTDDGFILDRGFAVFIEQYPKSLQLLDYDALELQQFLPGAKVKLSDQDKLASVSDPLRRRRDIFKAITSPVGTPMDKMRLLPLFYTVMTKSIEELFEMAMDETDTLSCLTDKYSFSESFISQFFAPFLEGIYLAPLDQQSSRMFHESPRLYCFIL